MSTKQRLTTVQQAKVKLIEHHNSWLANNDPEVLYAHVIHSWRVQKILDFTTDVSGKILDIGCFDGFVTEKIIKQGGKEVIGIDRLEKALKLAEVRGVKTILADIDEANLDFPDNHFDCVLAADVLNSVYDPDAVIEEIFRVLKPKGKLIITVPNLTSSSNRLRMLLGFAPYNLEVRARQGVGHLRLFTFKTMRELLSDHDFAVQKMSSSVFAFPLIHIKSKRPEYKQPRIFFSKFLAQILPKWGENIIVLAAKGKG